MNEIWKFYHQNTMEHEKGYASCTGNRNYGNIIPSKYRHEKEIPLTPNTQTSFLDEMIIKRRSRRDYNETSALQFQQLSKLLMLSNGYEFFVSGDTNDQYKMVPSAGARYPIELNLFVFNVAGLDMGTYHFCAEKNSLEQTSEIDYKNDIVRLCNGQDMVSSSVAVIALCANFGRTIEKYGERGYRYVYLDAGHVAQNIYLLAEEEGIGCVGVGGFIDVSIKAALKLPQNEYPIYLLGIGTLT